LVQKDDERDMPNIPLHLGVDTGGTFTDLVAWDGHTIRTAKVPSTPPDFQRGVVAAVQAILQANETAELVHGSTVATNALLERKGHPVAFITTEGFADLLLIGRQNRPRLYEPEPQRSRPIVSDEHVFAVAERMAADGTVLTPLDPAEVAAVADRIKCLGLKHVAVCLLFAFVNPIHEQQIAKIVRDAGLTVTISSELLPEFREYERASATVINAALRPNVEHYLGQLSDALPAGVQSLRIMHSGGGTLEPNDAARFAARLLLSGPAGGVLGASFIAKLEGFDRAITYDMGGTSTDVAAIIDGKPPWTTGTTIDGLPVPLAMFDIHTIGAGGGSIAALDIGGALTVGPRSAGANPGPACYNRGGREPTVTDANLVLGRLVPGNFLGGKMALNVDHAYSSMAQLALAMKKSIIETALGIVRIAESSMAAAIRHVTAGRGHDPRSFTLISFGGAGGLHAVALAEALEIPRVLIPPHAGLLSALGMVVAPPLVDVSRTIVNLPGAGDQLEAYYAELEASSGSLLAAEATEQIARFADCRFRGQSYELTIAVDDLAIAAIERGFRDAYTTLYGHCPQGREMEIVTLRLRRIGRSQSINLPVIAPQNKPAQSAAVILPDGTGRMVPVLDRPGLAAAGRQAGPALLCDPDSTAMIPSGWVAQLTSCGAVLLERQGQAQKLS
jgi:N-methylhydantoinase A